DWLDDRFSCRGNFWRMVSANRPLREGTLSPPQASTWPLPVQSVGPGKRGRCNLLLPRDAPHRVSDIICDQQSACVVKRHSYGPAAGLAGVQEPGNNVLRLATGTAVRKWDKHDLVTIELTPVPTTMLADEGTAAISVGKV